MKMRGRILILLAGDMALFVIALAGALMIRKASLLNQETFILHLQAFAPLFIIWTIAFQAIGLYDVRSLRRLSPVMQGMMMAVGVNWLAGIAYFYFLGSLLAITPKTSLLLAIIISHTTCLVWRELWRRIQRFPSLRQKVLILGSPAHVRELHSEMLAHRELGLQPVRSGGSMDIVIADAPWVERNWGRTERIFAHAIRHRIPMVSLMDFYESFLGKIPLEAADEPAWLLQHILSRRNSFHLWAKRGVDLTLACLLFIPIFPVIALTAMLVRIIDGKPVLFRQKRMGQLGREFMLFKFRTMRVHAGGARFQRGRIGELITPLGLFLRKTRLDELPQIFNVLKGDMSLVGPRPETTKLAGVLEKLVPNYHLRHLIRPGVTGWAQTTYWAPNTPSSTREKVQYDLYYLKNASFRLDAIIILRTLRRVLAGDSALSAQTGQPVPLNRNRKKHMDIAKLVDAS